MPKTLLPEGQYAMTLVEIARRMGYRDPEHRGKKAVAMLQQTAIRKLRRRPEALQKLLELSALRQRAMAESTGLKTDGRGGEL